MKKIDVVIPVRNEESNVARLADILDKTLGQVTDTYKLIFVVDPSTDRTAEILEQLSKKYPILIHYKKGLPGKGYSIIEGTLGSEAELVAFIDGDLQYPPEAIIEMVSIMDDQTVGVVVANRKKYHSGYLRRVGSRLNKLVFGKLLLGLDCDIQSGLKIFRRRIFDHMDITTIGPWTFDIPLLHTAVRLGYTIGKVDIEYTLRSGGSSKVKFMRTAFSIAGCALKTASTPHKIYHLDDHTNVHGEILYKKHKFTPHTLLPHRKSAIYTAVRGQKYVILGLLALTIVGLLVAPLKVAVFLIAVLSVIYFSDVLFSVYLILKSLHFPPEISFTKEQLAAVTEEELPIYSVMCPLYKESQVLPQFVEAMNKMDYPKDKMDVLILLEENDKETIEVAEKMNLPEYFRIIVVPHSMPKTKPKACNYGIHLAKGEYMVVYDAEDIPESTQLKKGYLAFKQVSSKVICIQAKLNYYNPKQNLLTTLFTAEYSLWFDVILPGLQSINTIIPLGGTSNHFRTKDLINLHSWDPFNVTEDCDLGVRLFKDGYKTEIMDSITLEEANSNVKNWIRQRSRWIKGYLQTYLVHMRDPIAFVKEHKWHALIFQLIIGLRISFILINPILWVATISYFTLYQYVGPTIEALYPTPVFYMAAFSLVFGNFIYLYNYMIGLAKRGHWAIIKYVYLVPFYWAMMGISALIAFHQLIFKPHFWEKTHHGLHMNVRKNKRLVVINNPFARVQTNLAIFTRNKVQQIKALFLYTNQQLTTVKSTYFKKQFNGDINYKANEKFIKLIGNPVAAISFIFSDLKLFIKDSYIDKELKLAPKGPRLLIFNWRDIKHVWSGGAEIYIHEIAKRLVTKGYEIVLFTSNDKRNPPCETIDGVHIVRVGGFFTVYVWAFLFYIKKFRNKFDLIIDSENGVPFFTPLYSRKPVICLIHHVHQEIFKENLPALLARFACFLEGTVMPLVYREVQMITVSKSSREDMIKLGLGNHKEIDLVHPGIELKYFKTTDKTKEPTLLYLGRLKPYKSIEVAIKAMPHILNQHPTAKLKIAGFGESRETLENYTKSLGLEQSVEFLGKVSEEDKVQLLGESWVFVQPSSKEGWGISVIEANACGTPVIAANVKGLKDSTQNPHTGYLVTHGSEMELAEKACTIISNKMLRKKLEKNCLEWAKNFTWDTSTEKLDILLNSLRISH